MAGKFASFARGLDYSLFIVTTAVDKEPSGCLVGFATQCSIHPPRFLACLSRRNHTFRIAQQAEHLAVHVVEEKDKAIAELFGGETGDAADKFARTAWRYVDGVPVLEACERWFVGAILQQFNLGDHVGFLLEPLKSVAGSTGEQLTFQQARDIEPGHEP